MDLKEMQKETYKIIEEWNKKHGTEHNKDSVFPHLVEEVGELAREYNHRISNWRSDFDKEKFSEEMCDVLIQLLVLATDYDVDLEKAFEKKIAKLRKRFELDES